MRRTQTTHTTQGKSSQGTKLNECDAPSYKRLSFYQCFYAYCKLFAYNIFRIYSGKFVFLFLSYCVCSVHQNFVKVHVTS